MTDYMPVLIDTRNVWQRSYETEVGTVVQNDHEFIRKEYITDYTSIANRDIMVYEEGSYIQRYVYGLNGERTSAEFSYYDETERTGNLINPGENPASDFAAVDIQKIYYFRNLLDSTMLAMDRNGEVISHVLYNEWGKPLTEPRLDHNFAGIKNINNYTGYTYDYILDIYFAQNRFYNSDTRQFIQQDPIKDGMNFYQYVEGNPLTRVDWLGLYYIMQKVKFVASSPGSSLGELKMYSEYKVVPETWQTATLKTLVGNIPVLGVDWYPGSGGSPSILVHGKEYWLIIGGTSFEKSTIGDFARSLAEYGAGFAFEKKGADLFKFLTKEGAKNLVTAYTVVMNLINYSNRNGTANFDDVLFKLIELNNIRLDSYMCIENIMKVLNGLEKFINDRYSYFLSTDFYANSFNLKDTEFKVDLMLSGLGQKKADEQIARWRLDLWNTVYSKNGVITLSDGRTVSAKDGRVEVNKVLDDFVSRLNGYNYRLSQVKNIFV